MCRGLNLAFRQRACAVLREGVCVFCEDAKAMAMISTVECSITILSLSLVWETPLHPKIHFTFRHCALFFLPEWMCSLPTADPLISEQRSANEPRYCCCLVGRLFKRACAVLVFHNLGWMLRQYLISGAITTLKQRGRLQSSMLWMGCHHNTEIVIYQGCMHRKPNIDAYNWVSLSQCRHFLSFLNCCHKSESPTKVTSSVCLTSLATGHPRPTCASPLLISK